MRALKSRQFLPPPLGCGADLDGDGVAKSANLASLLGQWNLAGVAELTDDGAVDASDLAFILGSRGPSP